MIIRIGFPSIGCGWSAIEPCEWVAKLDRIGSFHDDVAFGMRRLPGEALAPTMPGGRIVRIVGNGLTAGSPTNGLGRAGLPAAW